jgi:hypothetical protein
MNSHFTNRRKNFVMRYTTIFLAGLLVSAPLHAQNDGTEQLSDVRARTAIQQVLRNTQSKGVPIDALVRKVREGVSKQADPSIIQTAVQLLAKRLETSFTALAPTISNDELAAGAAALQVGVPVPTLRELRKLSPAQPLTVPLGILTQLVAQRVPVGQATKNVRALLARGANNAQLYAMGEDIKADVDAGIAPEAALDLRAKGVMSLLLTAPLTSTAAPARPPIRPR